LTNNFAEILMDARGDKFCTSRHNFALFHQILSTTIASKSLIQSDGEIDPWKAFDLLANF
jgi:hypothetical protein